MMRDVLRNGLFLALVLFLESLLINPTYARIDHRKNVVHFNGHYFKLDKFSDEYRPQYLYSSDADKADDEFPNLPENFPWELDLRSTQSAIKNQGDRGSCTFFSTMGAMESAIIARQGVEVNLSEEYLLLMTKYKTDFLANMEGSVASLNVLVMALEGVMLEKDYPYAPSWFEKGLPCEGYSSSDENAPKICYTHNGILSDKDIERDRIPVDVNFTKFKPAETEQIIKKLVESRTGAIISLPVHPKGWIAENGEISYTEEMRKECLEKEAEGFCGGHSLMLVGFDRLQKRYLVKNSWGEEWGIRGYAWMPMEYLAAYGLRDVIFVDLLADVPLPTGFEKKMDPRARNVGFRTGKARNQWETELVGDFTGYKHNTLYISSFLVSKKDSTRAIGDDNAQLILVPPKDDEKQKKYGPFVRSKYYFLFDSEKDELSLHGLNVGKMTIDEEVMSFTDLASHDLYWRVTAYYHDDVGWKPIYRRYRILPNN